MAVSEKQRAYRRGLRAEWACIALLTLKGYAIVARRWRAPGGEVDIVARKGDTLAFVEVKARPTRREALEALTPRQRARIARAALAFLAGREEYREITGRFDVMLVSPWRWPAHMVNAWRADEDEWRGNT